jgi:hypothetical protein
MLKSRKIMIPLIMSCAEVVALIHGAIIGCAITQCKMSCIRICMIAIAALSFGGGGVWFIYDTINVGLPACANPATEVLVAQCEFSRDVRLTTGAMHIISRYDSASFFCLLTPFLRK